MIQLNIDLLMNNIFATITLLNLAVGDRNERSCWLRLDTIG
jgi:hypothetical protein